MPTSDTNRIFTFWEGTMPEYIKLCMASWKFSYTVLNYNNLHNYTDLLITDNLKRFTLPQIADCVRAHVLRDQGGYWLDADTIMLGNTLPDVAILGNNFSRANTIGFLYTEPNSDMFIQWAAFQDNVIFQDNLPYHWNMVGNAFTDSYMKEHLEVVIGDIINHWPEVYMIKEAMPRYDKYQKFYFSDSYYIKDIKSVDILMLHNSWTPAWYKKLSKQEVLTHKCTLSNILRELNQL